MYTQAHTERHLFKCNFKKPGVHQLRVPCVVCCDKLAVYLSNISFHVGEKILKCWDINGHVHLPKQKWFPIFQEGYL